MTSCENLCTAEKCAELEREIADLRFKLQELEFKLDGHIFDRVTNAHDFDLNITGILQYNFAANSVTLDLYLVDVTNTIMNTAIIESLPLPFVAEWDFQAHLAEPIPQAHSYEPVIELDVFSPGNGEHIIKLLLDGYTAEDTLVIEPYEPEIQLTNQPLQDGDIRLVLSLDGRDVATVLEIEKIDIDEYFNSQQLSLVILERPNNDYQFIITFGNKTAIDTLDLPLFNGGGGGGITEIPEIPEIPPTTVSVTGNYDAENNNLNVTVTVDGVSATALINLDDMPFQDILDCLQEIKDTLEEEKELETVTIMAAPEVQANIKGTVLVLDFTTVDAFPKLNETGSKWRVQIPDPKDDITWDDLKDIRWFRGSQYAQVKFENRINSTSGWFASEDSADSYFAQISALTKLEVATIIKSKHSNPQIFPEQIKTRVFRGFKVFVGENGEPNGELTEVFKPPKEEEEEQQQQQQ